MNQARFARAQSKYRVTGLLLCWFPDLVTGRVSLAALLIHRPILLGNSGLFATGTNL